MWQARWPMSENLRNFTKAIFGVDAVVTRVPDDAWDNPSPCEGWTARDVLGHHVGVLAGIAHMAAGQDMIAPTTPEDLSDPQGLWAEARDSVLETLDQPGSLQHHGKYWFGPMTIDQLLGITVWDPLAHAWDIGKSTGVDAVLAEDVVAASAATIGAMRDGLAKRQLVGAEVSVAEGASAVDRFLGLIGRDPDWLPGA